MMRITLYMIQDIWKNDKKADPLGWVGRMPLLLKSSGMVPRNMDTMQNGVFAPEILHIFERLTEEDPFSLGAVLLKAADDRVAFRDLWHLCGILVNGKLPQPLRFFDLGFPPKFDDHWIKFLSSE
jgi:hypothetical protein